MAAAASTREMGAMGSCMGLQSGRSATAPDGDERSVGENPLRDDTPPPGEVELATAPSTSRSRAATLRVLSRGRTTVRDAVLTKRMRRLRTSGPLRGGSLHAQLTFEIASVTLR